MIQRHFQFIEGFPVDHVGQHAVSYSPVIPFCPQELFKVKGMHMVILFIANAVALYPFIVQAKKRPAADYVKAPVNAEEFQRRCNIRKFLQLIKKQKRPTFGKPLGRVHAGNIPDNIMNPVSVQRNLFVFWFFHKIDGNHAFVVFLRKVENGFRLSSLAGSPDNQRQTIRILLPFFKEGIDFSFKVKHTVTSSPCLDYTKNEGVSQGICKKMSEFFY